MTAWAAFSTGTSALGVLVAVFTFSAGGPAGVAAVTVLRVLPGGLLGLLAATLATSRRPQLHLAIGIGARALVTVATIVAVLGGTSIGVVLALAGASGRCATSVPGTAAASRRFCATSRASPPYGPSGTRRWWPWTARRFSARCESNSLPPQGDSANRGTKPQNSFEGTHTLLACSAASRARTLCAVTAREGSATTASYAAATSSRSQASIA